LHARLRPSSRTTNDVGPTRWTRNMSPGRGCASPGREWETDVAGMGTKRAREGESQRGGMVRAESGHRVVVVEEI
jgi:hypothetical protein